MPHVGPTQREVLDALMHEPHRMDVWQVRAACMSAAGFGPSEHAIRNALRRLARRGLISVHRPMRGAGGPYTYAKHEELP